MEGRRLYHAAHPNSRSWLRPAHARTGASRTVACSYKTPFAVDLVAFVEAQGQQIVAVPAAAVGISSMVSVVGN